MRSTQQQPRPLRRKQHPQLSRRAAHRLLDPAAPAPTAPHEQRLAALLAALAPLPEMREVPEPLLATFAQDVRHTTGDLNSVRPHRNADRRSGRSHGAVIRSRYRSGTRLRRTGASAAVRAAAIVLMLSCSTFIAAAANALPAPAQLIVHNLFGSFGVPAPHSSPSTTPSAPATSTSPTSRPPHVPSASPSAVPKPTASASASASPDVRCSVAQTHAAGGHCGPPATTGPVTHTTPPGQGDGKGHSSAPHGTLVH